jgi:hypothetical protein
MTTRKAVSITYLGLAIAAVAYELSIRVFDRGNSEFAGMLSTVVTLPSSLATIAIGKTAFGVNPGDSDFAFVTILGLSALANAGILWMILGWLSRPRAK